MSDNVVEDLRKVIAPEGSWYKETWYEQREEGDFACIDVVDHGDGRWYRYEEIIVLHRPTGKHYAFNQDRGLTENQDTEVHEDNIWPVEKRTKVIETVEWVKSDG